MENVDSKHSWKLEQVIKIKIKCLRTTAHKTWKNVKIKHKQCFIKEKKKRKCYFRNWSTKRMKKCPKYTCKNVFILIFYCINKVIKNTCKPSHNNFSRTTSNLKIQKKISLNNGINLTLLLPSKTSLVF